MKRIYGDEAAPPGTSNHRWALAVDIGTYTHARISYDSATYAWLSANAGRYGWVKSTLGRPEWQRAARGLALGVLRRRVMPTTRGWLMTDEPDTLTTALERVGPETRALLDFLVDRPLENRPGRLPDDKTRWAVRDLRATVRFELYGAEPGHNVTLQGADELLRKPAVAERVWDRLTSRPN